MRVPVTAESDAGGAGAVPLGGSARPLLLVVFGPGGVGKGTLVSRLLEMKDGLWLSRSWTTRPRRPGEAPDAYVFVTREQFLDRLETGGFVEWTEFPANGHLYGTPTIDAPAGRDILLEIEIDGASQIKALYPHAVLVLVVPPSKDAQAQRLRQRGDDEQSSSRRLELGAREEQAGRRIADHVVVNDQLEQATLQLADIVGTYRRARAPRSAT